MAEAHRSGADKWDRYQRENFANDNDNLVITSAAINQSKSDRDIADWPDEKDQEKFRINRERLCAYYARWKLVKNQNGLRMDIQEQFALGRCT